MVQITLAFPLKPRHANNPYPEPSHRLGGLTSSGLGKTHIGYKAAIGGLARQFYQAVREHYSHPTA